MAHEQDQDERHAERHAESLDESEQTDEPFHASSEQTIFDNVDPEFWAALTMFAQRRRSRHGAKANKLPEAREFVNEAVLRVLSGDRAYDGRADLFPFLCSVVNSLISHAAALAVNSRPHLSIAGEREEPGAGVVTDGQLERDEDAFERTLVLRNLIEHLTSQLEPDLQEYMNIRLDERYDTEEKRAAALNTTADDLRNRIRRIRRRAKALGLLND